MKSKDAIGLIRIVGSAALYAALAVASSGAGLLAQTSQQRPVMAPSELARQNMSRVAATVGQLAVIFHRDPGLMMELKRWIAKDATDHGQLISDDDLTEEAIFDRLQNDTVFRAVATSLVQKYGFLKTDAESGVSDGPGAAAPDSRESKIHRARRGDIAEPVTPTRSGAGTDVRSHKSRLLGAGQQQFFDSGIASRTAAGYE